MGLCYAKSKVFAGTGRFLALVLKQLPQNSGPLRAARASISDVREERGTPETSCVDSALISMHALVLHVTLIPAIVKARTEGTLTVSDASGHHSITRITGLANENTEIHAGGEALRTPPDDRGLQGRSGCSGERDSAGRCHPVGPRRPRAWCAARRARAAEMCSQYLPVGQFLSGRHFVPAADIGF